MKFRSWLNVITIVLLALAIYFGWGQISQAWGLMGRVDLRIFALMVPIQFFSYYAVGEVMFSYLRSKGELGKMSRWGMTRIALELNFVNHIIPVPSIAGFSYLGMVLQPHEVSAGRATMAQLIRYVMMFVSFIFMILISVIILAFDQGVSRTIIVISAAFIVAAIISMALLIYIIGNRKRVLQIAGWLTRTTNKIMNKLTHGKKPQTLELQNVKKFFIELHQDYVEIRSDQKILIRPFIWALVNNLLDVGLISIAFMALGSFVNPAALIVACGISSFAAIFAATPGGSGVYEAIMIAFLASVGVSPEVAIAGTLLARATLMAGTIIFGYLFYQLTINEYGKIDKPTDI